MGDILRMIVVLSALCGLSGFALSYLKMCRGQPATQASLHSPP